MFTLGQEHIMEEASKPQPIMFTAGAVPIKNRKGEISMEKVHVRRYVAGKRPEWANEEEEDSEDEERGFGRTDAQSDKEEEISDNFHQQQFRAKNDIGIDMNKVDDQRLRRLMQHEQVDVEERLRRRRVYEPEVIAEASDSEESVKEVERPSRSAITITMNEEESSDEGELDEDEIENRRARLRERARAKRDEDEELLALPNENKATVDDDDDKMEDEEYTSEEESEYSDSEDDDGPRLKPVFVRKKDRLTIQEREKEEEKQRLLEEEAKRAALERKKYTIKVIEKEARAELEAESAATGSLTAALESVDSDDGNDEAEYELWKVRELKRVKRDREEREAIQKEKEEVERLRNMTEEERRAEARTNPKKITNQSQKGKYRFLQKYYHRGAFFMDKDEDKYMQDFTSPTLEDHFDKTVLPKVMQVKNFGRSGRTKYTHLVDQDTSTSDSAWAQESAASNRFMANRGGGMKQNFDRPAGKKQSSK
ncbi:unnamed protein product [Clavelina lepadiformis]|uniref:Micro-fibrillar-associated protein 1 C-terminal domain-containing protein n=1 Tax=Clavelina lepadiformis TaxID=159417 RepID=A0ABP0H6N9_CLALP